MTLLPAVLLLALGSEALAADGELSWSQAALNKTYTDAEKAAKNGLDKTVGLRVWVVKGSGGSYEKFYAHMMRLNKIFNNEDDDAVLCGVRFRFEPPAREIDLPKEYHDLVDFIRDQPKHQAYYGNTDRLSKGEVKLFELMGATKSNELNVVYIPGLGGGRGYTYQERLMNGPAGKMTPEELPGRKSAEDTVKAYKNTILLSDTAGLDTLAHEAGHALTGRGHSQTCDAESAKADPEGCAAMRRNLMLADGRYGDLLSEDQCRAIGSTIRRKKLER